jgi:hypothetical protein
MGALAWIRIGSGWGGCCLNKKWPYMVKSDACFRFCADGIRAQNPEIIEEELGEA